MEKKVGIITMHKVKNFGSALQAYATQHFIESLGYECELIDYIYPNLEHSAYQNNIQLINDLSIFGILRLLARRIKVSLKKRNEDPFKIFYKEYFNCSKQVYYSRSDILSEPPKYDVYVTGSDQVWNPNYIGFDVNFFLEFAPIGSKKISYGSSFAISEIPPFLKSLYAAKLNDYQNISVREITAKKIIKELIGIDPVLVCDPTLLLDVQCWNKLADKSTFKTDESYLLVYLMGYAYNPYPDIYKYIERINTELSLPIIYLNANPGYLKGKYREIIVPIKGPCEFLYLISHASFVITDSFHGTAFSLNYGKKFISCLESKDNKDSRILDLLYRVGAEDHAVVYNKHDDINFKQISDDCVRLLEEFRSSSKQYLVNSLEYGEYCEKQCKNCMA